MSIKLVVMDIDGTLVTKQYSVPKENINTIKQTMNDNPSLKLILASGRSEYNMLPILKTTQLDQLKLPIVSYNGGGVFDWVNNEFLYKSYFKNNELKKILKIANDNKIQMWAYDIKNHKVGWVGDKRGILTFFMSMRTKTKNITLDVNSKVEVDSYKISLGGTKVNMKLFIDELKDVIDCNIFDFSLDILHLSNYRFIEISPKGTDKILGIKYLCKKWNITKDEVMCIGDGSNDIEMLKWAKYGIAMGNANYRVKKTASEVTLSNKQSGVAHILKKYFLK